MRSMTGYGKANCQKEDYQIDVEMKAVNHRFLDIQCRLPKELNEIEMVLKNQIKQDLLRGRIECFITVTKEAALSQQIAVHWALLEQLVTDIELGKKERDLSFSTDDFLTGAVNHPSLVEVVDVTKDNDALLLDVKETVKVATLNLLTSRQDEGVRLLPFFKEYIKNSRQSVKKIADNMTFIQEEHYQKLSKKLEQLMNGQEIDESRVLTEVALLVERGDIQEELDRLMVHFDKLSELIENDGAIGKEIDFLIQEMNREVNTIGSKTGNITIKEEVVFLKTMIEKMREQTQNIE